MSGKGLSPAAWKEIRERYQAGEQIKRLSEEYGVARETISRRIARENWKHPAEIKAEAIKEFEEESKRDWKRIASEANETEIRAYKFIAAIGLDQLSQLKRGILPGQAAYQLRVLADSVKIGLDGIRSALRIDDINSPYQDDGGDDTSINERLIKLLTPVDAEELDLGNEAIEKDHIDGEEDGEKTS